MDDGEVDISDHVLFSNPDMIREFHEPVDGFLDDDDFLKNMRTCTHTHTCNPPGPDTAAHTHTCYHTHTQVFATEGNDESNEKQYSISKSRRPSGNREAVRKYREKKKAQTAYLEEEVEKLRVVNQQLLRRLQGQGLLESEVLRLRTLLLDLRGKIDTELGVYPLQKPCADTGFKEGDCSIQSISAGDSLRCEMDVPCLHPHTGLSSLAGVGGNPEMVTWERDCEALVTDCRGNVNGDMARALASAEAHLDCQIPDSMDMVGSLVSSASQAD
eukprot:TRINITY_DN2559_c1_g1_i1.p1 TRINITY_DN2559_c1_g1~~TRINITY_DN2559_c1_g1_i1.p1  ORF type:complete len:272 (-),score=33.47 TRINITY_DN2559_c1_g1_i1:462-1277(-)